MLLLIHASKLWMSKKVREHKSRKAKIVKKKKKSNFRLILRHMLQNKGAIVGLIIIAVLVLISVFINFIFDYDKDVIAQDFTAMLQRPSIKHLFGTDHLGRDLFARVLYGTRFSLSVGVVSVLIAVLIGVPLGAIAGYYEGFIGEVIMRITDIFSSIPAVLLAIVIVSALGTSMFNLMLAVGISSVPQFIRITRASVLTVRNQEFIESARAIGKSEWYTIFVHVLPNCLSPIIVQVTLRIANAIILASSLSFLGLGVTEPTPEWGALLSAGRNYIRGYGYLTFIPGLAIMITVLAFNLVGDALRDALDPKLRK